MMKRNGNAIKMAFSDKIFYLICMFILALFMMIVIYPLWFILIASFSDPLQIYNTTFAILPKGFTLHSYELAFKDSSVFTSFLNSVAYTVVGTVVNILMTVFGAFPLSKKDLKGRTFFTIMFTIPMFFGGGLIPSYLINSSLGLRNNFWVMVIPGAVSSMYIFIMRTYFQSQIPAEIEDAAKIDGCSNMRYLRKIVLPLSVPIIAVFCLYYGVAHWNDYFTALIYFTDKALYPLQYVLRSMLLQNMDFGSFDVASMDTQVAERVLFRMGLKYALMVIATVPVLVVFPIVQKYFSKGVIIGSIKG